MNLKYSLSQLDFATTGEYAHPRATVHIEPDPCATMLVPSIKLQIRISSATAAAGLPAIAAEAVAAARRLVPETAAQAHLQVLLEQELQLEAEERERTAAALQAVMGASAPPSGG